MEKYDTRHQRIDWIFVKNRLINVSNFSITRIKTHDENKKSEHIFIFDNKNENKMNEIKIMKISE